LENWELLKTLSVKNSSRIVLLVMDGVGGIQVGGETELEKACTPNLDRVAAEGVCGLMDPVFPGITPGSGPGHISLFGYDPVKHQVGRGILGALGIGFHLEKGDVAARINFATIDEKGLVTDRRAGRIPTELNQELCRELEEKIKIKGVKTFVRTVKEHRAVLVIRGEGLSGEIKDTDPQKEGLPPLDPEPMSQKAESTASLVREFIAQAKNILASRHPANMVLLRGFSQLPHIPSFQEIYQLNPACIAGYPMYKGVARLVGMEILSTGSSLKDEIETLKKNFNLYDFFFIHIKPTDSAGEDGDFERKVKVIEEVDALIPEIISLNPDVLAITADHSTPSLLKAHSWHAVPVVIRAKTVRTDAVKRFTELECARGALGRFSTQYLMSLLMAHALKLSKFGA